MNAHPVSERATSAYLGDFNNPFDIVQWEMRQVKRLKKKDICIYRSDFGEIFITFNAGLAFPFGNVNHDTSLNEIGLKQPDLAFQRRSLNAKFRWLTISQRGVFDRSKQGGEGKRGPAKR